MTTDMLCMHKHAPTIYIIVYLTFTVPASPEVSPTLPCQYNNMTDPTTSVTPQTYIPSLAPQTLTKSVVSVTALGALLVLSLLLLTMVTTGWVCTYISMTKREAKKNSTHTRYYTSMLMQFGMNNHGGHVY